MEQEFSHKTRQKSLERFKSEVFDLLVIGGGITGAAAARNAASRGLKVALVEREDFAYGTSSRSSKLIHGGLRYLENLEFHLVFEALAERTFLLKTAPHRVRPLLFFFPVYKGDIHGRWILSLGLWLYDLLSLFRAPGFHKGLSQKALLEKIPFLKSEGLQGGFEYYDASMWDEGLVIETLRAASRAGCAIANQVEALEPLWDDSKKVCCGFRVQDRGKFKNQGKIELRAKKVIVCAGPWTDQLGLRISSEWKNWLNPSKGVHLVFDLKRIPIPGALVMGHSEESGDGRISFVIPRHDLGAGVVIVGTTDGPTPADPDLARVEREDVDYLMSMLKRYFPSLRLTESDIISTYVGVRPLMGKTASTGNGGGLQKVSREHFIGHGVGGVVFVAGGKYTTHRKMGKEAVDFALKTGGGSEIDTPINELATSQEMESARKIAKEKGWPIPQSLFEIYGKEALGIYQEHLLLLAKCPKFQNFKDPSGFPLLLAQFRHHLKTGMVLRLEDFYLRRLPLFLSLADSGLSCLEALAEIWAEEMEACEEQMKGEIESLKQEISKRRQGLSE